MGGAGGRAIGGRPSFGTVAADRNNAGPDEAHTGCVSRCSDLSANPRRLFAIRISVLPQGQADRSVRQGLARGGCARANAGTVSVRTKISFDGSIGYIKGMAETMTAMPTCCESGAPFGPVRGRTSRVPEFLCAGTPSRRYAKIWQASAVATLGRHAALYRGPKAKLHSIRRSAQQYGVYTSPNRLPLAK